MPAKQDKPPETPKSKRLEVEKKGGESMDRAVTNLATSGLATNASLVVAYSQAQYGELSLSDMVASLRDSGKAVNANNLAGAEQMLNAQAVALNSIFGELARRASLNMGQYLGPTETYLRLALKAQAQCRTTLETLAAIKNPPVVYAKQANIAHGPQQVNNGPLPAPAGASLPAHSHGEHDYSSNELLEARNGTRLDAGAQGQAGSPNSWLATVEPLERSTVGGRKGQSRAKQSEARRTFG